MNVERPLQPQGGGGSSDHAEKAALVISSILQSGADKMFSDNGHLPGATSSSSAALKVSLSHARSSLSDDVTLEASQKSLKQSSRDLVTYPVRCVAETSGFFGNSQIPTCNPALVSRDWSAARPLSRPQPNPPPFTSTMSAAPKLSLKDSLLKLRSSLSSSESNTSTLGHLSGEFGGRGEKKGLSSSPPFPIPPSTAEKKQQQQQQQLQPSPAPAAVDPEAAARSYTAEKEALLRSINDSYQVYQQWPQKHPMFGEIVLSINKEPEAVESWSVKVQHQIEKYKSKEYQTELLHLIEKYKNLTATKSKEIPSPAKSDQVKKISSQASQKRLKNILASFMNEPPSPLKAQEGKSPYFEVENSSEIAMPSPNEWRRLSRRSSSDSKAQTLTAEYRLMMNVVDKLTWRPSSNEAAAAKLPPNKHNHKYSFENLSEYSCKDIDQRPASWTRTPAEQGYSRQPAANEQVSVQDNLPVTSHGDSSKPATTCVWKLDADYYSSEGKNKWTGTAVATRKTDTDDNESLNSTGYDSRVGCKYRNRIDNLQTEATRESCEGTLSAGYVWQSGTLETRQDILPSELRTLRMQSSSPGYPESNVDPWKDASNSLNNISQESVKVARTFDPRRKVSREGTDTEGRDLFKGERDLFKGGRDLFKGGQRHEEVDNCEVSLSIADRAGRLLPNDAGSTWRVGDTTMAVEASSISTSSKQDSDMRVGLPPMLSQCCHGVPSCSNQPNVPLFESTSEKGCDVRYSGRIPSNISDLHKRLSPSRGVSTPPSASATNVNSPAINTNKSDTSKKIRSNIISNPGFEKSPRSSGRLASGIANLLMKGDTKVIKTENIHNSKVFPGKKMGTSPVPNERLQRDSSSHWSNNDTCRANSQTSKRPRLESAGDDDSCGGRLRRTHDNPWSRPISNLFNSVASPATEVAGEANKRTRLEEPARRKHKKQPKSKHEENLSMAAHSSGTVASAVSVQRPNNLIYTGDAERNLPARYGNESTNPPKSVDAENTADSPSNSRWVRGSNNYRKSIRNDNASSLDKETFPVTTNKEVSMQQQQQQTYSSSSYSGPDTLLPQYPRQTAGDRSNWFTAPASEGIKDHRDVSSPWAVGARSQNSTENDDASRQSFRSRFCFEDRSKTEPRSRCIAVSSLGQDTDDTEEKVSILDFLDNRFAHEVEAEKRNVQMINSKQQQGQQMTSYFHGSEDNNDCSFATGSDALDSLTTSPEAAVNSKTASTAVHRSRTQNTNDTHVEPKAFSPPAAFAPPLHPESTNIYSTKPAKFSKEPAILEFTSETQSVAFGGGYQGSRVGYPGQVSATPQVVTSAQAASSATIAPTISSSTMSTTYTSGSEFNSNNNYGYTRHLGDQRCVISYSVPTAVCVGGNVGVGASDVVGSGSYQSNSSVVPTPAFYHGQPTNTTHSNYNLSLNYGKAVQNKETSQAVASPGGAQHHVATSCYTQDTSPAAVSVTGLQESSLLHPASHQQTAGSAMSLQRTSIPSGKKGSAVTPSVPHAAFAPAVSVPPASTASSAPPASAVPASSQACTLISTTSWFKFNIEAALCALEALVPTLDLLSPALKTILAVARKGRARTPATYRLFVDPGNVKLVRLCLHNFKTQMSQANATWQPRLERGYSLGQDLLSYCDWKVRLG